MACNPWVAMRTRYLTGATAGTLANYWQRLGLERCSETGIVQQGETKVEHMAFAGGPGVRTLQKGWGLVPVPVTKLSHHCPVVRRIQRSAEHVM
jgi:hypothetical protein